jgi:hypothetical protein
VDPFIRTLLLGVGAGVICETLHVAFKVWFCALSWLHLWLLDNSQRLIAYRDYSFGRQQAPLPRRCCHPLLISFLL